LAAMGAAMMGRAVEEEGQGCEFTAVQSIHGQLAGKSAPRRAHAAHGKGSERGRGRPANLGEPKAGAGLRRRARLVRACGSG
jgi:hypothetical protein